MSSGFKMDPELKQKWIAALKSGEYKQGKACLHNEDEDTYCCLGVLNEVAQLGVPGDSGYLGGAAILAPYIQGEIVRMNDCLGYSFEGIANWIEENL